MKATRKYSFLTKAYGDVRIDAETYDTALEEFLRRGYLETDIEEVC